jgi:hypothetical protein
MRLQRLSFYCVLFTLVIPACSNKEKNLQNRQSERNSVEGLANLYTGAEALYTDENYILTSDSSVQINAPGQRSDSISHTGRYSLKLTKESPYGFTIDVRPVKRNEIIKADFWCYGFEPYLVCCDSGNVYYNFTSDVIDTDSTGWKKIGTKFRAPGNLHDSTLRIYVWNYQGTTGYIDDFSFERTAPVKRDIAPDMLLKILIKESAMAQLTEKRNEALSKGILATEEGDYVKAVLVYMGDTLKGSIRLKGDWLDHLEGEKWSYRVKLKQPYSWKGMKTFSLQTPASRSFIDEWLLHKLFKKEDVLTTRYGFINIELNGEDMGVYAYEEHFEKLLVESNNRREGPIIKFSEDAFWYCNRINLTSDRPAALPIFEESVILPFKPNRTANNPSLLEEFEIAQNLLEMHRDWNYPLQYIFDIEKLARYLALIDVAQGYHGIAWHNQRFYYNPVTCTLEPIAFDCYTADLIEYSDSRVFLGFFNDPEDVVSDRKSLVNQYFINPAFRKYYYMYLDKFSDEAYIKQFLRDAGPEIHKEETLLKEEFFYYNYNDSFLLKNASRIRKVLEKNKEYLIAEDPSKGLKAIKRSIRYEIIASPEAPPYYVNAYLQLHKKNSGEEIKVVNNYAADVDIIGYVDSTGKTILFVKPCKVRSINTAVHTCNVEVPINCPRLLYTVKPFKDIFSVAIFPWKYPEYTSPRIDLLNKSAITFPAKFTAGNKILIPAGTHEFDEPVVIPEGYKVEIRAGANLNFINGAFFLSYSPVKVLGETGNEVKIFSADGSSMGFIILQPKGKSLLQHVVFDGLQSLNYKGWKLTGAVTFYESKIDLSNVQFINNHSEDALNIIRSDFSMTNCSFENIFSDAFDSDFSDGTVEFSNFRDIRNDALDFSGSVCLVRNCHVKNAKDKGISVGERSDVKADSIRIENVNIGLASKDGSQLEGKNIEIVDSRYGLLACIKKPEYPGAVITTNLLMMKDVSVPYVIERGSGLYLDKKFIAGTEEGVAEMFY